MNNYLYLLIKEPQSLNYFKVIDISNIDIYGLYDTATNPRYL